MKQITIISGKGGTGKTSITSSLTYFFNKPAIVDADVETENMKILLSPASTDVDIFKTGKVASINENCIECGKCIEVCIFDAISTDYVIDPLFCEGCGACGVVCPEDAIDFSIRTVGEYYRSSTDYGELFHAKVFPGEGNSGELVSLLRRHAEAYAEKEDKLILIDGSPGTGCPVIASITGVDMVVIVSEPTLTAVSDMMRVIELTEHFKIKCKIIINKYDINKNITKNIEKICKDKDIDILGKIPFDNTFVKSVIIGKPIVELAPDSKPSEILKVISDKIIAYINE
jgi:MinD superfamily P-loop ATPase